MTGAGFPVLADRDALSISVSTRVTTTRTWLQRFASRGIRSRIRRRGEQPLVGMVRGKPRRRVVERTNSWHSRFRGLLVRWEPRGAYYLARMEFVCRLIAFQQAT